MVEFCKSLFQQGHLRVLEWLYSNPSFRTMLRGYDVPDIIEPIRALLHCEVFRIWYLLELFGLQ